MPEAAASVARLAPVVERPVAHSFTWTLTGNIFASLSTWGVIVILARFGDKATVGRFALALAIAAPIAVFTNLQLRSVEATDARGMSLFGHYVALRLLGTAVFALSIATAAWIADCDRATLIALAAVAAIKAADSFSEIVYGSLQAEERMDRIAQSQILKAVTTIVCMLAAIRLTGSSEAGIAAFAGASWLVFLAFDQSSLATGWAALWDAPEIGRLFRLALPLAIAVLLVSINANIPRYALERYRGTGEVGVFAALAYAAMPANLMVMTMGQALAPRMARAYVAGARRFALLSAGLFAIAGVMGAIGIAIALLAGQPILSILYGPEYARESSLLIALMWAGIASYFSSAAGCSLTSARYFRAQVPIQLMVSAATAILCVWKVPSQGMAGAAMAQAGGYLVQLVCSLACLLFATRRRAPEPA